MVSLTASLSWWARRDPQRIAMVYRDRQIAYGEMHRRVTAVAGLLSLHGIRPGDVVALLMKNSAGFIEIAMAVSHVAAVLLPINYRLGRDEIAYIVEHAGARLLFADDELLASIEGIDIEVIAVDESAQADSSSLVPGEASQPLPAPSGPLDLFRLMYTSGTTDRPKGVMHSYENWAWKCLDHISALGLTHDDRLLVVGPLYHVGAFDLPGLAVLLVGGRLVVMREFEPAGALALIERERLTGGWMAPVMLNRVLACPGRERFDTASLRWLIGGGERTPEERIREFGSLFRAARYIDAYGLTETCSGDTMMEPGRELQRIGSTGRALAHVQISIRNDAGAELPAGEPGEICVRGPKVTAGYWNDAARTAASFIDGWLRTGDVGYLDADGFLYLTDRKKDMIISGGENIASSEVERVLYQMPQVLEAAVVGVADEQWGERVAAVVVLRPGAALSADDVRRHCEGRLARFKTPRQIVVRDDLPRNPSGKVLKRVLREELAAGTAANNP